MNNYTRSVKHSLDTHAANADNLATKQDVGYTNRIFIQALFPYKKPSGLAERERQVTNGARSITVYSPNGLPYGKYPRLIMALLNTIAVENAGKVKAGLLTEEEARRIPLGSTMASFMEQLGLQKRASGGQRGALTLVREQLSRLTASTISVQMRTRKRDAGQNMNIVKCWDLWYDEKSPNQETLGESYILLSEEYYQQAVSAPIPLDLEVLLKLSRPRSIDLYMWSIVKKYRIVMQRHPSEIIPWADVSNGLTINGSTEAKDIAMLRREIKKAILELDKAWPEHGLEATRQGLIINNGPLPVAPKGTRLRAVK